MDRKQLLAVATSALSVFGLAAAACPFALSLGVSQKTLNDSLAVITLPPLEPGVISSVSVHGRLLFVLRPDPEQRAAVRVLEPHVWDSETTAYRPELDAYVYWGYSTKWGCPLEHRPPQKSRLTKWDASAKWLGGYWDPWGEVSYDYAGRAIKTARLTYNGYYWRQKNLRTPVVFQSRGDDYIVSIFERR